MWSYCQAVLHLLLWRIMLQARFYSKAAWQKEWDRILETLTPEPWDIYWDAHTKEDERLWPWQRDGKPTQ